MSAQRADELVQDVVADMLDRWTETRHMLDRRYDEIASGKVQLIPGDEIAAHFRRKCEDALGKLHA